MIRLLERAAAAAPDHDAVITPAGTWSYAQLLTQARQIAAALVHRDIHRFAVLESDAAWVITLLAGAALVGAEPCQYQPDTTPEEFAVQAATLSHDVVITKRTDLVGSITTMHPEVLMQPVPASVIEPAATQPIMIRTTGTTGAPKAARHDWLVLARTVAQIEPRPNQRWLLAYGPHQFAGVQVLQHVMACQGTLIAPFPRQPRDGLAAMLTFGVTCISATPTYWRFLLAEARSQKIALPPLEQITLGGEAVPADLLKELRGVLPDARISQIYASTELGSVVSIKDDRPGFGVETLLGPANPDSNLQVIDGELWVRATAGMIGYAGESESATPADTEWNPTGDMVEIVGDRVEFRGRSSEIINVGGVKVHPLPIEDRIAALPSVAVARVFGRANRMTGAIVAVEVVPAEGVERADLELIRQEIKAAVAELPRAAQPRSITFVDAIETLGEKTVRRMET